MAHTRFIAVAGKGQRAQIQAYLYAHTSICEWYENDGTFAALLLVVNTDQGGSKSRSEAIAYGENRAQHLADYQAGRLQSGLYFARVYDTRRAAFEDPDVAYLFKQVLPVGTVILVAPGPSDVLGESRTVFVREEFADRVRAIIATGATVYGEHYDRAVNEWLYDITRNTRNQDAEMIERYVSLCEQRLGIEVKA